MRRTLLLGLLVAVLSMGVASFLIERTRESRAPVASPGEPQTREATAASGRPGVAADKTWLAGARDLMGAAARDGSCGPYRLLTDRDDEQLAATCRRIADTMESVYTRHLGLRLVGDPRGTIIAFDSRQRFRDFTRSRTGLAAGYSAMTRPSRGVIVLVASDDAERLAPTLAHEIAHLLHRRAFGPGLPPWLSEGIADAVSDRASTKAARLPHGPRSSVFARRLLAARDANSVRAISELLSLDRAAFDSGVPSYDYEHSALLVGFLLEEPQIRDRFLEFLDGLASSSDYSVASLFAALEVTPGNLETRFWTWVQSKRRGPLRFSE